MHYGSKGWYVEELKKKGITHYEGRKLQSFKSTSLPICWKQRNKHNVNQPCCQCSTAFFLYISEPVPFFKEGLPPAF